MTSRVRTLLALLAGLAVLASATGTAAADDGGAHRTTYTTIEGTGSTWSELIVQKWIADVDANGMKVVYTGGGSSKGRKDFAQSTNDFAISEIPYQGVDEQGNADKSDRPYAYLPIVAGGTAFTYQLKVGGKLVRNLRLSGETITKIFTGAITNWNDAAITKDNNGRAFPSLPITPVVRSDGSGTTAQFTTWMDNQYPSLWRPYFGKSGLTSYYPRKSGSRMVAQSGSDQVMNTVKGFAGNGTIGYVEYSYPKNANYPVVKVLNKAGYFIEPTQYNTAVALTKAVINPTTLTQDLTGVYVNADPRAYPISSYSYMIIPTGGSDTRMTTAKRQTLADFIYYSLCGGQTSAGSYGYSPLPLNLVQAGFDQVAKLKAADPAVELTDRDVKSCNNPTFDGKNLKNNVLAKKAPQPAACDKSGAGPCGTDTGTGQPSTDQGTPVDPAAPAAPAATGAGAPVAEGQPATVDPETGAAPVAATGTTPTEVYANPTLVADRAGDRRPFGVLAVVELLLLVLVPGVVSMLLRRRRLGRSAA
ncbi:phosphate ABC transporter substrate-binding protein PstS [Nocardioides nitrophenolicus]|uniref:phosphate ABC transporter substrate-binding protein PstS n=1 Tax=Nocardioides nitrophenolicus TaxID=60489 RepID=UPI00195C021A|nr:phosphate ABC transporter substrate-binding protein PstS [Nocardioides nitrophenolicus]MBM7516068.1 phosphate ABC transporter phosphate-binding protein [Nocardioides nitrophenolicus]